MSKRARNESISSLSDVDMDSDDESSEAPTPSASTESDHPVKYAHIQELKTIRATVIRCALPPHKSIQFYSYADYDTHYQQCHSNRCPDCSKNFPSDHYLNLHIADNHNPLNEVLRERGDATYACFVEDCDYKSKNQHKRKMHAIDKHGFPKFYDFFIVNTGIDKRTSMLRPKPRSRKNSRATNHSEDSTSMEVEKGEVFSDKEEVLSDKEEVLSDKDDGMEDISSLTTKMSALNFVPRGVRFGKTQRGGFKRQIGSKGDFT